MISTITSYIIFAFITLALTYGAAFVFAVFFVLCAMLGGVFALFSWRMGRVQ